MPYTLAPHVSFCRTAGGTVVLDLRRDRYFQLPAAMARSLGACAAQAEADDANLRRLVSLGVLAPASTAGVAPTVWTAPCDSLLERDQTFAPGRRLSAEAVVTLEAVHWRLRWTGLLASLERLRCAPVLDRGPSPELLQLAAGFHRARQVSPRRPVCLADSLALLTVLARRGPRPRLVIGVDLQPFSAHSWVQADGLVLNDGLDRVRSYQPILVV